MPGTLNVGGHDIITHSGDAGAGDVTVNVQNRLVLNSSGNVGIGTSSPAASLDVNVSSMFRGDGAAGASIHTTTFRNTRSGTWNIAQIEALAASQVWAGDLVFKTTSPSFSNTLVERMRINSYGRIQHNTGGSEITAGGGAPQYSMNFSSNSGPGLRIQDTDPQNGNTFISFLNAGTVAGTITSNGSQTINVNNGSDYRIKENINPLVNVKSRFLSLNPVTFNYIGKENTIDGFIAHEVSEIVPRAVTGVKDAVDAEGNIIAQGLDTRKLVPLITAALKEAFGLIESQQSQIDALTARIEALEATS